MKIGPKYKIARRLKARVFEKTQTQKYTLREERKIKNYSFNLKTDFGLQLNEKQKARMFYCISEKQFAGYVKKAIAAKKMSPASTLFRSLECRLDNVIWRAGILPTHLSARQAAAHGHFMLNGKRVYTPSIALREGDKINIRPESRSNKLFTDLDAKMKETSRPGWLFWDDEKKELVVQSSNFDSNVDMLFDLGQVIEYYQR